MFSYNVKVAFSEVYLEVSFIEVKQIHWDVWTRPLTVSKTQRHVSKFNTCYQQFVGVTFCNIFYMVFLLYENGLKERIIEDKIKLNVFSSMPTGNLVLYITVPILFYMVYVFFYVLLCSEIFKMFVYKTSLTFHLHYRVYLRSSISFLFLCGTEWGCMRNSDVIVYFCFALLIRWEGLDPRFVLKPTSHSRCIFVRVSDYKGVLKLDYIQYGPKNNLFRINIVLCWGLLKQIKYGLLLTNKEYIIKSTYCWVYLMKNLLLNMLVTSNVYNINRQLKSSTNNLLYVPKPNLKIFRKSISYAGPKL